MITNADSIPGFRDRLAILIGDADPFTWAKRVGIPSSTFDRIWNLGTTPKARHLIRIADSCGVSLDWLLTGRVAAGAAAPDTGRDLLPIPWLGVAGDETGRHPPLGRLALDHAWLARTGCPQPEAMALAAAAGDSMEPTLRDGDLLLVDTSISAFRDDAVYLLAVGDSFIVKRVQRRLDGSVVVRSDNPAYASETLSPVEVSATRCLGRVRWIGRIC